ncbi:MAG: hypothetical protein GX589_09055 [Deltaproteobacteria bacterium]|nr:hypothetical protein [Deltaproteobacteria bacterium]
MRFIKRLPSAGALRDMAVLSTRQAEIERSYRLLYGGVEFRPESAEEVRGRQEQEAAFQLGRLLPLLKSAGFSGSEARKYVAKTVGELVLLGVLTIFGLGAAGIWICPCAAALEYLRLRRLAFRRAEGFESDYTALLIALASGIRTGLDPLVALNECASLFPDTSLVRREIEHLDEKISCGLSEQEAIQAFAETIDHPDLSLFRVSFLLARREGSSLAHCLQRLGRVTRQRQSFRRKIKAAVAMQKLSSLGIVGCGLVIGLFQMATNSQALLDAIAHPVGIKIIAGGVFLMALGVLWMMHITRARM